MLERNSVSKSVVYTEREPIPMFSNSCTQDRINPLKGEEKWGGESRREDGRREEGRREEGREEKKAQRQVDNRYNP